MRKIEALAQKIANKLAIQLDFDDEKKSVIAYGLIGMLQMVTLFILILALGMIFHFAYEAIIIFLSVGIIRKSAGGAHAKTMMSCNIMSVITVILLSALSSYIAGVPLNFNLDLIFSVIVFAICFTIFYIRVPVDTPNKPIIKPEKVKRLRKQSLVILLVLTFISMIFMILSKYNLRFYSIGISIRLAMLWQFFTLTKIGIYVIDKIDLLIYQVINKR